MLLWKKREGEGPTTVTRLVSTIFDGEYGQCVGTAPTSSIAARERKIGGGKTFFLPLGKAGKLGFAQGINLYTQGGNAISSGETAHPSFIVIKKTKGGLLPPRSGSSGPAIVSESATKSPAAGAAADINTQRMYNRVEFTDLAICWNQ